MRKAHKFDKSRFEGLEFEGLEVMTHENWMVVMILFRDENGKCKTFGIFPHNTYAHIIDTEDTQYFADFESGELLPQPPRLWGK